MHGFPVHFVDFSSAHLNKGGEECLKPTVSTCLESTHNPEGFDPSGVASHVSNECLSRAQFYGT